MTRDRSFFRRVTRTGLRLFIALLFAAMAVLILWEALAPRGVKRPPLRMAVGFAVVFAIFSLYGLDHALTGIRRTRTRWLSAALSKGGGKPTTLVVWAVLILFFFGFLSVLMSV